MRLCNFSRSDGGSDSKRLSQSDWLTLNDIRSRIDYISHYYKMGSRKHARRLLVDLVYDYMSYASKLTNAQSEKSQLIFRAMTTFKKED